MKLSEPITDVEQLTPALLTDRFGRNGFLKSGSVTSIEKTGSFESPLMDFYYKRLIAGGIENYSRDQFEYDYRLSVLSCVFCPILWKRAFSVRNAIKAYQDWDCGALLE